MACLMGSAAVDMARMEVTRAEWKGTQLVGTQIERSGGMRILGDWRSLVYMMLEISVFTTCLRRYIRTIVGDGSENVQLSNVYMLANYRCFIASAIEVQLDGSIQFKLEL